MSMRLMKKATQRLSKYEHIVITICIYSFSLGFDVFIV
jgi:hypothetical protein